MNDAVEALKARSSRSLTDLGLLIEGPLTSRRATDQEIEQALQLGRAQFAQLNALLKSALDTQDAEVFTETEREWARMFEHEYVPEEDEPFEGTLGAAGPNVAVIRQLTRYRETLSLGLAMWAAHLHEKRGEARPQNMWIDALRILSQRFPSVERLLATYERAAEGEEEERFPWSDWFLSELPQREAHWIPTQAELLFTTILLCTMLIGPEAPVLSPQPWLQWRGEEVDGALQRLDEHAEIWRVLVPVPALDTGLEPPDPDSPQPWHERVARARAMFKRLKEETESDSLAKLREAPLDPDRVATFRSHLLASTRNARLVRDIFQTQSAVESLTAAPEGHVPMASRSWMPKSYFTADSRVIGLDWAAGDLSRVTANSEIDALLGALDSTARTGEAPFLETVRATIRELRDNGRRPSLVVIPIGWDLRRALDLPSRRASVTHDLIPVGHTGDFEGVIDDVPVIDFPHVPKDKLWVVDLAAAAKMREWPSDEESGITFELRDFDEVRAQEFLAAHPEVRPEGASDIEAVHSLQEKLLLTLTLCWEIARNEPHAGIALAIPKELQRD